MITELNSVSNFCVNNSFNDFTSLEISPICEKTITRKFIEWKETCVVCLSVCIRVSEKDKEKKSVSVCACVCACVCERERESVCVCGQNDDKNSNKMNLLDNKDDQIAKTDRTKQNILSRFS